VLKYWLLLVVAVVELVLQLMPALVVAALVD
jgi:hypothetical protein